ncbi:MAG: outer membrane lipoprotein chaperone LolA [Gammaproteobacteria bacterium]|nr:outer membrane lipoprotein chaperone LolA [Gammaproteobacteria bacterium]
MRMLLLIASLACAFGAQAQTARAQLEQFLRDTGTLRAQFEQKVFDDQLREISRSGGTMAVRRPGKFRWDYRGDTLQTIVADGVKVWIYDPELEQVTVRPLDVALGNTPALLLTGVRPLGETFEVREYGRQGTQDWVELKPKGDDATFVSVRVGMDGGQIQVMEMVDNFGQLTELRFSQFEANPPLDGSVFEFKPPKGVDVIESN